MFSCLTGSIDSSILTSPPTSVFLFQCCFCASQADQPRNSSNEAQEASVRSKVYIEMVPSLLLFSKCSHFTASADELLNTRISLSLGTSLFPLGLMRCCLAPVGSSLRNDPLRESRATRHGEPFSEVFVLCSQTHGRSMRMRSNKLTISRRAPVT